MDEPSDCPYLDDQEARMPLVVPTRRITPEELDVMLENGRRRSGVFYYHTQCPRCSACQPTRVDVHRFEWTTSLKRVRSRGDKQIVCEFAAPQIDQERLDLFNRHRDLRGLNRRETAYQWDDLKSFLVDSSCPTTELSFWVDSKLVGVSIVDCGQQSLSAVYTYFDPDYSKLSLGTYSVLKQFQWALESSRRWVYLGMYVAQNQHLSYKARFTPQQRWINNQWSEERL